MGALALRLRGRRTMFGALLLALTVTLLSSPAAVAKPFATITLEFADSCRDFSAHSNKDISHVVIHYSDGRVVEDEAIDSPDYVIDGSPGDEIDSADVKSGQTRASFTCTRTNDPPSALLEIETPTIDGGAGGGPRDCSSTLSPPDLYCFVSDPRTVWTQWEPGTVWWFFCETGICESTYTFSFRGTSSTDPNHDIESWEIDFGDGTSMSGSWLTEPPTEVSHEYSADHFLASNPTVVTLTVTDSAGATATDATTTGVFSISGD